MTDTPSVVEEICVAYTQHGSRITEVPIDLYRTLKHEQYRKWFLYIMQALNYLEVALRIGAVSMLCIPGLVLWVAFYADVQGTIQAFAMVSLRFFPLMIMITLIYYVLLSPSGLGLRNVFAEALVQAMRRHVPVLCNYTEEITFIIWTGESAKLMSNRGQE